MAGNQAKPRELTAGKVYLRDTRNGQIHDLQSPLDTMPYMAKFIAGEEVPRAGETPKLVGELTGHERAAEYDRLASMSKEDREAEQQRIDNARAAQAETDSRAAELIAAEQAQIAATAAKAPPPPLVPTTVTPVVDPAQVGVPDGYRMTAKAAGALYGAFRADPNWTDEAMISNGYMEKVSE